MNKNILVLVFSALLISSCGGGGGGGGGSNASPITYSYDKITSDFTNKTWEADSITRRLTVDQGTTPNTPTTGVITRSWDYFATYGTDPDGPIEIDFIESSGYLTINLSHKLDNFNITLSEIDRPIYDPSDNLIASKVQNNFTEGTLNAFFFLPDYLATLSIEHTAVGFLDFYLGGPDRDTFAINYGSRTNSGDMPRSGSATFGIFSEAIYTQYRGHAHQGESFIVRGEGNLNVNFSTNKIGGTISLDRWYNYLEFINYGATYESQLLDSPVFTLNFPEASISGNSFEYDFDNDFTLTSSGGWGLTGSGIAGGSFFGPDGKEISGTFLGKKSDDDMTNVFDWDIIGVFYGTCKPSGC